MNQERRKITLAMIRLAFSIAQIGGATALAVCLYRFGPGHETMIALFITMSVTILSIILFRVLKIDQKAGLKSSSPPN